MSLLVVGSIAFDDIESPSGSRENLLGGSATHFSLAASSFAPVQLVGAVGEDFPMELTEGWGPRGINTAGVEVIEGGKTFRWSGRYEGDMNAAETLKTELNVLGTFDPKVPEKFRGSDFVFLANTHPATQRKVLEQMANPRFVLADTMNLWIENEREALLDLLKDIDALLLNDEEARMLSGKRNLIAAGQAILDLGPKVVIVKKGEHGSFLFSTYQFFALPAYPLETVVDPTGAGDSFAVQDFGCEGISAVDAASAEARYEEFLQFVSL
ncbi:MAG: PfkB family carbohydrate kinase [Planctomycetota bacterium]|jgi:sugar/nucleoside kinase (ribokinase family)